MTHFNASDMDMLSLGALAESLAPRISAYVSVVERLAGLDPDSKRMSDGVDGGQILADRIEVREALRAVIADARELGRLQEMASAVGAIGRASGIADLLLSKYADLFTEAAQGLVGRLRQLDPMREDRGYRALWTVIGADNETPGQAIERIRQVDDVLRDID